MTTADTEKDLCIIAGGIDGLKLDDIAMSDWSDLRAKMNFTLDIDLNHPEDAAAALRQFAGRLERR